MLNKRVAGCLGLLLGLVPVAASAAFDYQDVVDKAEKLSGSDYKEPAKIPDFLRELDYNAYQNIRFDPEKRLWKPSRAQFQVMLVPAGLFYTHPVKINVIDASGLSPLSFDKSLFNYTDPDVEKRIPADLGYAGFKLTYPFSGKDSANQFLVFAGASYFRGVGSDNAFGISARGIAVNTGLNSGEEFPSFTEFWLVRPSPKARHMTIYALLDGPSLTGAYRFVIYPGKTTRIEVKSTLFPRSTIELAGIAPLTSMFFYGENTPRPRRNWRPEVHDSDGLLINDAASGEWLWRPLVNPRSLQMDYLRVEQLKGFGLLQRDDAFTAYQDLEAHYQRRPNTWVEPEGEWGTGHVVLVQLPTPDETNDNIVAFWKPSEALEKSSSRQFDYTLKFGNNNIASTPMAITSNTFVGAGDIVGGGNVKNSYRLIIDFKGGALDELPGSAGVIADVTGMEGTDIVEQFVEYNPELEAWRVSILAKPGKERPLTLRAFLKHNDETMSETWTYRLPADSRTRRKASR